MSTTKSRILERLKGDRSLDEAIDEGIRQIATVGQRRPFRFRTTAAGGHSQTELYPQKGKKA